MTEYIERWALNSSCQEIYEETVREHKDMTAEEVRKLLLRFEKAIKQAPAADVVEVVHAEWEEIDGDYRCTNCHHAPTVGIDNEFRLTNFCPYCGAEMRV